MLADIRILASECLKLERKRPGPRDDWSVDVQKNKWGYFITLSARISRIQCWIFILSCSSWPEIKIHLPQEIKRLLETPPRLPYPEELP